MSSGLAGSAGAAGDLRPLNDATVADRIRRVADREALATVLYGSYARGTATIGSDIDVLQIVSTRPGLDVADDVTITRYTYEVLAEMARRGSLFVLHLRIDSQVLSDSNSVYQGVLQQYKEPTSYEPLMTQVRLAASALHKAADSAIYLQQLQKLGTYLLRTAIYVRLAERGTPLFDITAACNALDNKRALEALKRRRADRPSQELVDLIRESLEELIGNIPFNAYNSVEGLAVAVGGGTSLAAQLLANVVAPDGGDINYSTLTPPML